MMNKAAIVALVILALGLAMTILIEEPAPDFTVVDAYGQTFKLSEHRGDVVVLEFMYTTCPSCEIQTGILRDVRSAYDQSNLVIISITTSLFDDDSALRQYSETQGAEWIFARDSGNVVSDYDVTSVPHMFFIDRSGVIASSYVGVLDEDGVSKRIDNAESLLDSSITVAVSAGLIIAAVAMLSYLGYSKREMIRERLFGGSESS